MSEAAPSLLPDWVVDLLDDVVRHPLRSALTSVSVAWGTFMLVVLLGLGEGLQNAVRHQFRDDATNSVWIYRGQTSIPFDGYPLGRRVQFDDADIDAIDAIPEVEHLTGRFYAPSGRDLVLSHGDRKAAFGVRSVHPDHRYLENTQMVAGRYLDPLDLEEKRKVIVIGREIARFLFGETPHERLLGTWIEVAGNPFQIIGVFSDAGGEGEESEAYLPITTARTVFAGGDQIHQIMFTVGDASLEEVNALTDKVHARIAQAHHIHPNDRKALRVRNNVERFQKLSSVFDRLANFVWVVGIGTVLAGIVGVSNIMLVSVKERTVEIGLRKALGETPGSLVFRVVREAVLLTAVSGYAGVVGGVLAVEAIDALVPANETLRNPTVDLDVALFATVLLTVAGAAAGFVPAWRAASVKPIVALRGDA